MEPLHKKNLKALSTQKKKIQKKKIQKKKKGKKDKKDKKDKKEEKGKKGGKPSNRKPTKEKSSELRKKPGPRLRNQSGEIASINNKIKKSNTEKGEKQRTSRLKNKKKELLQSPNSPSIEESIHYTGYSVVDHSINQSILSDTIDLVIKDYSESVNFIDSDSKITIIDSENHTYLPHAIRSEITGIVQTTFEKLPMITESELLSWGEWSLESSTNLTKGLFILGDESQITPLTGAGWNKFISELNASGSYTYTGDTLGYTFGLDDGMKWKIAKWNSKFNYKF